MKRRDVLRIGIVLRSQGIKGEVKIHPLTDDVSRYRNLKTVVIEQDGAYRDAKITVNRFDESGVFAYLEGCYTRVAADALRDCYICVDRQDAIPLPEGSWFIADLEGLRVRTETEELGTLCEVIQTGGVDVYRIQCDGGKSILFPALKRVISEVDIENGLMKLDEQALAEVRVDED